MPDQLSESVHSPKPLRKWEPTKGVGFFIVVVGFIIFGFGILLGTSPSFEPMKKSFLVAVAMWLLGIYFMANAGNRKKAYVPNRTTSEKFKGLGKALIVGLLVSAVYAVGAYIFL